MFQKIPESNEVMSQRYVHPKTVFREKNLVHYSNDVYGLALSYF